MMSTIVDIPKKLAVEESVVLRRDILLMIKDGKKDFLLNFENCEFIDSTGLGVLVAIYKRTSENGGSLKLKSVNEQVMKIFKLTRLDKIFQFL
jgi:anti-sigma B factor antagonist